MRLLNIIIKLLFEPVHVNFPLQNNNSGSNPPGKSRLMLALAALAVATVTFVVIATVTQGAEQYT